MGDTRVVEPDGWRGAVGRMIDDGLELDWISVVDHGPDEASRFEVVAAFMDDSGDVSWVRSRTQDVIDSVVDLAPQASWHERETAEMFGVEFAGSPDTRPLLLHGVELVHPLRRESRLDRRVDREWPGAGTPGEAGKRKLQPPGARQEWQS